MENQLCRIEPVGSAECLFRYTVKASGRSFEMGPPAFQVDGRARPAALSDLQETAAPVELANAAVQHVWRGRFADEPDLSLELTARLAPDSPVVRFRYRLSAARPMTLTKTAGCDDLLYLTLPLADMPACKEVRLSEFDRSIHSYRPTEQPPPRGRSRPG